MGAAGVAGVVGIVQQSRVTGHRAVFTVNQYGDWDTGNQMADLHGDTELWSTMIHRAAGDRERHT